MVGEEGTALRVLQYVPFTGFQWWYPLALQTAANTCIHVCWLVYGHRHIGKVLSDLYCERVWARGGSPDYVSTGYHCLLMQVTADWTCWSCIGGKRVFCLFHERQQELIKWELWWTVAWSPGSLDGWSRTCRGATGRGVSVGGAKSWSKKRGPGKQCVHQLELRNVVGMAATGSGVQQACCIQLYHFWISGGVQVSPPPTHTHAHTHTQANTRDKH